MERSLRFVLLGTFTLRFSTGLTGAMLGLYLAKLPLYGGPAVDARLVGLFAAIFYLAELVLSPIFGILSDRTGHHRVMLYGPIFGAVAVVITGLTAYWLNTGFQVDAQLPLLGFTRLLEGASTAASVPSILGFIALATAGNELLRGKAAARFEGATLAGLGFGFIVAPTLFATIGANAFYLNALVYGVSFLIYWRGVKDPAGEAEAVASTHVGIDRYFALIRSSHVLVLAPTWIALNASIGLWFSQSLFQFSQANPAFPDQTLMRGFDTTQITLAAVAIAVVFGVGLIYWGNRFKSMRRTTIIGYGIVGGGALVGGGLVVNHSGGMPIAILAAAVVVAGIGLFVMAGATPAALGLLADISERFPADRGAIMGLYSVFLAIGQIVGSLIGGFAAEWRGIDGMLLATAVLLAIALIPLSRLRNQEHEIDAAAPAAKPETATA
jgi:MFS family permease